MAGMPKYDASAERAADAYHRLPLPVKERDTAGSDLAGRTGYSDSHGKPPLTRYMAAPFRFGTPPRRPDLRVWRYTYSWQRSTRISDSRFGSLIIRQ